LVLYDYCETFGVEPHVAEKRSMTLFQRMVLFKNAFEKRQIDLSKAKSKSKGGRTLSKF
jgi:hypothetical protein